MPSPRATFFDGVQLIPQYEQLRNALLQEQYSVHLTKPLAFWALPTDRRLPLVLINRTLGDLLAISFEELCNTPSIGEKKIHSFLTLLSRAANTKSEDIPDSAFPTVPEGQPSLFLDEKEQLNDSAEVSELQWQKWQKIILAKGFEKEKLGRLCPTLTELTRVIWNSPLEDYCNKTLAEMREIRTHGEKRVTAILRIFHSVCAIVSKVEDAKHLLLRLVPENIDHVENWAMRTLSKRGCPSKAEIGEHYISPLLAQLKVDASEQICRLAENRIGMQGEITSIRQAAKALGLARARIYQLLNEINDILMVRWPNGRLLTSLLRNKFLLESKDQHNDPEFVQFHTAAELFFPWGRREDASDDYFFQFMNIAGELGNEFDEAQFAEDSSLVRADRNGENWNEETDVNRQTPFPAR